MLVLGPSKIHSCLAVRLFFDVFISGAYAFPSFELKMYGIKSVFSFCQWNKVKFYDSLWLGAITVLVITRYDSCYTRTDLKLLTAS